MTEHPQSSSPESEEVDWGTEPSSPDHSPRYVPGCLAKLKLQDPDPDLELLDPLSLTGRPSHMLEVSHNSREAAKRRDLDHIIGLVARELRQMKMETGSLPRYRCSGTRFIGRNIQMRFPDLESLEFYKGVVSGDPGPQGTAGYYVRAADEPPPYRKYRTWVGTGYNIPYKH